MYNDPAYGGWYWDDNLKLMQNDKADDIDEEAWADQFWTENLVPSILEEFCLDSERISPTNKEIVNETLIPNCTTPTNMSITFSTYGTYTFFYSGGSDGIVIDEIDSWNYVNELPDPKSSDPDDFYEQFEIVIADYNLLQRFAVSMTSVSFSKLRFLYIESLTDDSLVIRIEDGDFGGVYGEEYNIHRLYKFSAAQ